ncbi:hypothetical protein [Novosphingobium sp. 9U]|uniref:hypothetical protein n=1 Tax=Novosphingobium sp. 9U TaxID=2653158 RepID=UPI0012F17E13|nr:hypothetical protein [Novosphingobium sp. 9U]VWX51089.1 Ribbon-helix-helix protein, copG family [Novosphingobium sp. 9U]
MKKNIPVGVGLSVDTIGRFDSLSQKLQLSRSEIVRRCVDVGLPLLELGHRVDPIRLVAHIEYLQAALETIIAREHSDIADRLLDITVERVEKFHA